MITAASLNIFCLQLLPLDRSIKALAEKRKAAKAEKNYALADEIRKEIADKGFILVDTKDGFTIKKA